MRGVREREGGGVAEQGLQWAACSWQPAGGGLVSNAADWHCPLPSGYACRPTARTSGTPPRPACCPPPPARCLRCPRRRSAGARVAPWCDPAVAIALSLWVVWAWGGQAREHILTLVGLSAAPDLLQRLTYPTYYHDPRIMFIDTVR